MAKNVTINYAFNKHYFPIMSQAQMAYLLIDVKPANSRPVSQVPLNLALVMDRSASMKGPKIENVKKAIVNIIEAMNSDDFLSLVVFNEQAEVLVPGQKVQDKNSLIDLIQQLTYSGGTAISTGLKAGLGEIHKHYSENAVNHIILLTDGQTYGDEEDCLQFAAQAHSDGILITALGVGDEWHEELLDAIAEKNRGKSDYIATSSDILPIFEAELKNLHSIMMQNARLNLRFNQGTRARKVCRVLPYISELDDETFSENGLTFPLGDLDREQGQSILVELLIDPRQAGRYRICQAELVYDLPGENQFQQKDRQDIVADFLSAIDSSNNLDARVMNIVERVSAYDLQTRALTQAKAGDVAGATRRLRAAATRLIDIGAEDLAAAAMKEAENLEYQGVMSSAGTKKLHYETRKLTQRLF